MTTPTCPPSRVEPLYPFLYAEATDLDAVVADIGTSITAKVAEIVALRDSLAVEHGERLVDCACRLAESFQAGATLFSFGNGGSSTDAQDLAKLFLCPPATGRPLPATSLTQDAAVLTALSNDVGFETVFARQVAAFGRPGDIAVGLSTSGGSANVLHALDEGARRGMVTVGFAGYDGGKMAETATVDHLFVVASSSVHRIQEAQTTLYHVLWELTQQALDGGRAAIRS